MKICFFLISNGISGGEKVIQNLYNHLNKTETINFFINKTLSQIFTPFQVINFIDNLFILNIFKIIIKRNFYSDLLNNFDIVNINLSHALFINSFFDKKRKNLVITLHGTEVENFINKKNLFYRCFIKPRIKKTLDESALIISVGSQQIQNLPSEYKKKTIVIPNGVDNKLFRPISNIKARKNVVFFAGRFIDIKGIEEIINVAKQLPQYEFWFAGQGPLAHLINLPNTKNLGFKTSEELVKLYNEATICIFPSHREAFGLVGLEAMSCGKPVIATPLGFSEYIENGKDGIIIPSKDKKSLKEAILNLMKNEKLRKTLSTNARKKALKYSWDKVANKYLEVFKEVVKGQDKSTHF